MTDEPDAGRVAALAAEVAAAKGRLLTLELSAWQVDGLLDELRATVDQDVRLALGRACTTAARTIEHLVAVLQLPYAATRGWGDFVDALGDRAASEREYLIVADAAGLLKHEDRDLWVELVRGLFSGPHCLGGGWHTLVLADDPYGWERTPFGSAGAARAAASWSVAA